MNISLVEPAWLVLDDVLAIQEDQIRQHGGSSGVRDVGLIESALGRVQQYYHYGGECDILTLAVRLGVGLAANHGFVDGNKRTGVFAMIEFLAINGAWLSMPNNTDLGEWFAEIIAHEMSEAEFVAKLAPFLS